MATIMGPGGDGMMKAVHTIAGLTGAVVGVTTTINRAAAKYAPNAPLKNQAFILLSRITGAQTAYQIAVGLKQDLSATPNWAQQQGVSVTGPFNQATFGGVILLIADRAIENFIGHNHGYKYAAPFLKSIGSGLLVGGIVGGLFDPPTNPAAIGNPAGRLAFAQASTPFLGAASGAMPATQGGLAGFNTGRGGY